MPWPAIAAGVNFAGGLLQNRGNRAEAQKDRQWQSQQAATSREFQSAEAGKQMAFQEKMRNTEWQAGVADMQAAGLNPALAYSQGGASAPMGARGSGAQGGGSRANMENILEGSVSSAMQAKRLKHELELMKENVLNVKQQRYESSARESYVDRQSDGQYWNNELMKLSLPGARNISNFEAGKLGQGTRTIRSLLQSVFGSGGAFKAR